MDAEATGSCGLDSAKVEVDDGIERMNGGKGKASEVEEIEEMVEANDLNPSNNSPIQSTYNSNIGTGNLNHSNSKEAYLKFVENPKEVARTSGYIEEIGDRNSDALETLLLASTNSTYTSTISISTTAVTTPSINNTYNNSAKSHPTLTYHDNYYQDDDFISAEPSSSRSPNIEIGRYIIDARAVD
ncbi:4460_t:CDS:2 [Acaulospora colombiana]|uniref:4460_t:CDS:1 n=1 Tax=Acaulospora colombiana TaxID=27376 RepID=A0ACA9K155_9GLOM|nr:4460_t:CDS:2 [Acaulospora colombiana]